MKKHVYQLNPDIHIASFLRAVDSCEGEVTLESRAGDVLDLKSQLSKYLLLASASDPEYLRSCRILCCTGDARLLEEFL